MLEPLVPYVVNKWFKEVIKDFVHYAIKILNRFKLKPKGF